MDQCFAQWRWSSLVKENLQLNNLQSLSRASRSMFKNSSRLINGHPRKPFNEVMQRRIVFEVFKKRRNWNARAAKDPCAAHARNVSLDC